MRSIFKFFSFFMAGAMGLFSPLNVNHGDMGCCAECTLKREEEVEVVWEEDDRDKKDGE
jgi:hypothetical protein